MFSILIEGFQGRMIMLKVGEWGSCGGAVSTNLALEGLEWPLEDVNIISGSSEQGENNWH